MIRGNEKNTAVNEVPIPEVEERIPDHGFHKREILVLLSQMKKSISLKALPLALLFAGVYIVFFVVQQILFNIRYTNLLRNSIELSDLYKSLECQE